MNLHYYIITHETIFIIAYNNIVDIQFTFLKWWPDIKGTIDKHSYWILSRQFEDAELYIFNILIGQNPPITFFIMYMWLKFLQVVVKHISK